MWSVTHGVGRARDYDLRDIVGFLKTKLAVVTMELAEALTLTFTVAGEDAALF